MPSAKTLQLSKGQRLKDEINYPTWIAQIQLILTANNLEGYIDSIIPEIKKPNISTTISTRNTDSYDKA
jgi:hypothetical protein